ncbi:MAG: response regulator [bacterium]|nr:response regulator [bacterium]
MKKRFPEYPVLLVDDEEPYLTSMIFLLKSEGLNHIISCSDSRRVMSILNETPVSLIVLDLSMPYITGGELLEEIRDLFPGTPVIIVSAHNEADTVAGCKKAGAKFFLEKPVRKRTLTTAVKQAIKD